MKPRFALVLEYLLSSKENSLLSFIIRAFAALILHSDWINVRNEIQRHLIFLCDHPELGPPLIAQRFLVSAEDRRHGRHPGYDFRSIARAIFRRITSSRREGASTIEQQIVRVITNRFELTWSRKVSEILLASLVARHFPKSATPAVYLSIGYYGWRMNDYSQACRHLDLYPSNLSFEDAAALIARLKYPEPHVVSEKRLMQIARRKEYLKKLYVRHTLDGTYHHLGVMEYGEPVPGRRELAEALRPTPCA